MLMMIEKKGPHTSQPGSTEPDLPNTQWQASHAAEEAGQIKEALFLHENSNQPPSYASAIRSGWLHFRAGHFTQSLRFYEEASHFNTPAIWHLYGMLNCHMALGEADKAAQLSKIITLLNQLNPPNKQHPHH